MRYSELDPKLSELMIRLFVGTEKTLFELSRGARPEEVTGVQYKILAYLNFEGPKNVSEIAECIDLTLSNASREIRALNSKNYIVKIPNSKDKRVTDIQISDKGRALVAQTLGKIIQNSELRYQSLGREEQLALIQPLELIIEKLL
jgi:DNA-binding MarR family transcriptional regulator